MSSLAPHPATPHVDPTSTWLAVIFTFKDLVVVVWGGGGIISLHPHSSLQTHPEQTGPLPRPQPVPSVGPEGETFRHPGKEESHLWQFWEQRRANEVQTELSCSVELMEQKTSMDQNCFLFLFFHFYKHLELKQMEALSFIRPKMEKVKVALTVIYLLIWSKLTFFTNIMKFDWH